MARKIAEHHPLWAVYIDCRQPTEDGADFARRQWIILPPLERGREELDEMTFRYFWRNQVSLGERTRWRGPRARDLNSLTQMLSVQSYFNENSNWDTKIMTVPVYEPELRNLKHDDKPTVYRIVDRAKRVARKKHGMEI